MPRNIYLSVAYISLGFALQSVDNYTDLTGEIDHCTSMGNIAMIGDLLITQVGMKQKTVLTVNDHREMPIPGFIDSFKLPKRNSVDKMMNYRIRKSLQLATLRFATS